MLVIAAIFLWTIGVGYLLTRFIPDYGILADQPFWANVVCYLDACCSAVGIANGVFILFRYREQWVAWYISSLLETAMNIIAGQWVLLVLKVGYLTNTTYGYIKWTRYIRDRQSKEAAVQP
mgnify:FL=1